MHMPMSTTSTSSRTTTRLFRPKDGLVNDSCRRRSSAPPHRRMVQDTANEGFREEGSSSSRIPRRAPRFSSYATSVLLLCLSSLVISVESQVPTFNPTSLPTLRPTPQPTRAPTRAPTAFPTRAPTNFPTFGPTPVPTRPPTRLPTMRPTSPPTLLPTALPTSLPTRAPTRGPTRVPTAVPTRVPTRAPTRGPTRVPTRGPTSFPTQIPTFGPTQAPSASPSAAPSPFPSATPTGVPTSSPSGGPTPLPSESPSARPTTFTPVPTITMRPTDQPSVLPTGMPSAHPSAFPTSLPSLSPSALPTSSPSSSPTLSQQLFEIDSVMRMTNMMNTMDSGARIDWEGSTAAHIRNVMNSLELDDELLQLQVFIDINSQVLLIPEDPPAGGDGAARRSLQTGVEGVTIFPLQVEFLVRVTFRSARTDYDVVDLIGEAFNSAEERQQYRARLKQLNADFDNLERVEILVNGTIPREEGLEAPDGGGGGGSGGVLIIAVAAGGVVMALVALSCLAYRRWGQDTDLDGQLVTSLEGGNGTKMSEPSAQQSGITAEILMERQDDVSTLGDPVYGMMTQHDVGGDHRDEATASVGNDYDYSKQYLKAQGIASVGSSRGRLTSTDSGSKLTASTHTGLVAPPSVFSDDASFEEQFDAAAEANLRFEVSVPPGKLGMVIDTPHGGVPLVHAIKPNSVLADQCMVNDRLVAVDGEDVTSMTAVQVSKLISLKADQQRTLVFVRPRAEPR